MIEAIGSILAWVSVLWVLLALSGADIETRKVWLALAVISILLSIRLAL